MPRHPNPSAVRAFESAIDRHHDMMNLEDIPEDTASIDLFHFLASALDWCEAEGVDFDATLQEVREHFASDAAP